MGRESSDAISPEARFVEVCERAGLQVALLEPEIARRMLLLAEYTATFEDCVRTMEMAERIFDYERARSAPFSEGEKTVVRVGGLFSDIGKTGPVGANSEQQRLVARVFSVEGVRNDRLPMHEFFRTYFSSEAEEDLRHLRALGLDPNMALRDFWNLHSVWTFELLINAGVPREAVAAAAAHHLLEHVNPYSMVADDGRFTQCFGSNAAFDRAEKLVILLDKYDAVRRRSRRDHDTAIAWLRALIDTHSRFGADREFHALIDALDAVFGDLTTDEYQGHFRPRRNNGGSLTADQTES